MQPKLLKKRRIAYEEQDNKRTWCQEESFFPSSEPETWQAEKQAMEERIARLLGLLNEERQEKEKIASKLDQERWEKEQLLSQLAQQENMSRAATTASPISVSSSNIDAQMMAHNEPMECSQVSGANVIEDTEAHLDAKDVEILGLRAKLHVAQGTLQEVLVNISTREVVARVIRETLQDVQAPQTTPDRDGHKFVHKSLIQLVRAYNKAEKKQEMGVLSDYDQYLKSNGCVHSQASLCKLHCAFDKVREDANRLVHEVYASPSHLQIIEDLIMTEVKQQLPSQHRVRQDILNRLLQAVYSGQSFASNKLVHRVNNAVSQHPVSY